MALTRLVGYTSLNNNDKVADTRACVLVMVMVSSAVPAALIVLLEKLLETIGVEGDTVSISAAEQTPATVQEADTLVLETLAGGVIDATLLT